MTSSESTAASVEARLEIPQGVCVLTYSDLNTQEIVDLVRDDAAGAIATFIGRFSYLPRRICLMRRVGTTRNSFKGKVVTRLEYQAYSKLAIKTMAAVVEKASRSVGRSGHQPEAQGEPVPAFLRCALYHRLGPVPVGEPSIVIAVSSPHRKEAFVACEQILEEVKQSVQIWKREFYEGEAETTAEWKENH